MKLCDCEKLSKLKIQAEMGADPIWCEDCQYNLEIDDIELSATLMQELFVWVNDYASWVDWTTEQLLEDAEHLEVEHNIVGEKLTEKVREELQGAYKVTFIPSEMYA